LEAKLNKLSDEKTDLEKLIREFGVRHNKELGELILKILQYLSLWCLVILLCKIEAGMSSKICFIIGFFLLLFLVEKINIKINLREHQCVQHILSYQDRCRYWL
jgi:hypothetical protein